MSVQYPGTCKSDWQLDDPMSRVCYAQCTESRQEYYNQTFHIWAIIVSLAIHAAINTYSSSSLAYIQQNEVTSVSSDTSCITDRKRYVNIDNKSHNYH